MDDRGLYAALIERGMTRRSFLKFTSAMAAALALPASYAPRIAAAVEVAPRLPLVWVRGQTCGGNTESFLRSAEPSVETLLLETLSVDYHQALMATAGDGVAAALERVIGAGTPYVLVVEGAIPDGANGAYCLVGGRPVREVVSEAATGALAVIAVGSCATDGGAPAAANGTTDAKGVRDLVGGRPYIALPGCPMNMTNLAAVLVHYLTRREWPPLDMAARPLAAYGNLIHNQCERRPHFEFGEFALSWGDEGAQRGWCLYKLGCKGPEAMGNCPTNRYGQAVSWNVRAGHGCIGCVTTDFWDQMGPAYKRLPAPVPFLPWLTTDMAGGAMVAGIGAVAGAHAVGMTVRFKRRARIARREALVAAEGVAVAEAVDAAEAIDDIEAASQPVAVPAPAAPTDDAPDATAEPTPVAAPEPTAAEVAVPAPATVASDPVASADPAASAEPAASANPAPGDAPASAEER